MKKTVSVILCMLVFITTVLSVTSQAADDDFIGMRFDLGENLPAGYLNMELSIYEDALRTTATASEADAHMVFNFSFNSEEYKYIAIMYRVSNDVVQPWFYMKDTSMPNFAPTEGTYTGVGWKHDGQWYKAIYYIPEAFPALAGKDITGLRLPGGELAGDTVDIRYICFFKTKEAAEAFEGFVDEVITDAPATTAAVPDTEPASTASAPTTAEPADTKAPVETASSPEETKISHETEKASEDSKPAVKEVTPENIKKVKTIVIILSIVILLCAIALFAVYMFKEGANKTFAAIIAVVLLICSIAIIIVFVLI